MGADVRIELTKAGRFIELAFHEDILGTLVPLSSLCASSFSSCVRDSLGFHSTLLALFRCC